MPRLVLAGQGHIVRVNCRGYFFFVPAWVTPCKTGTFTPPRTLFWAGWGGCGTSHTSCCVDRMWQAHSLGL